MQNITQVANWLCPDSKDQPNNPSPAASITPFPLTDGQSEEINCTNASGASTPGDPSYCGGGPADHGQHTKPPCGGPYNGGVNGGPWAPRDFWTALFDPWTQKKVDLNLYQPLPGVTVNLGRCQNLGFKAVTAMAIWHGAPGFEQYNPGTPAVCAYADHGYDSTWPATTKYLTCSFSVRHETYTANYGEGYTAGAWCEAHGSITLDPNTGLVSAVSLEITNSGFGDGSGATALLPADEGGGDLSVPGAWGAIECASAYDGDQTATFPGWNYDWTEGTVHDVYGNDHWKYHNVSTFSHSNTTMSRTMTTESYEADGFSRKNVWFGSFTRSDPYTLTQVFALLKSLSGKWNLADDGQYPWRTDPWVTVNPLVSYDGVAYARSPLDVGVVADMTDPGWQDPESLIHSGTLIGQPSVGAGSPLGPGKWPMAVSAQHATSTFAAPSDTGDGGEVDYLLANQWLILSIDRVARYNAAGVLQAVGTPCQTPSGGHPDCTTDPTVCCGTPCVAYGGTGWTAINNGDYSFCQSAGTVRIANSATTSRPGYTNPLNAVNVDDWIKIDYTYYNFVGGHFDRRHITYRKQLATSGDGAGVDWNVSEKFYGGWSGWPYSALDPTDVVQPLSATQWTTSLGGTYFPPGAFVGCTGGDATEATASSIFYLTKYAEIKLPWHGQSWFGPCGADRDKWSGYECVPNGSGGCKLQATGGLVHPQAWPIEGDRMITLVEDHTDNADVPSGSVRVTMDRAALYLRSATENTANNTPGYTGSSANGDAVAFGDHPVGPDASTPPSGPPSTITAAEVSRIDTADHLWFEFVGVKSAIAGATAVRSGLVYEGTPYTAPAYWWYDDGGKGECTAVEFLNTFGGSPTTTTTIHHPTFQYDRCTPAVVCFSPNYVEGDPDSIDKFPNGVTYLMGGMTADTQFGFSYQAAVRQIMADVYWSPPGNKDCQQVAIDPESDGVDCRQCDHNEDNLTPPCPDDDCAMSSAGGELVKTGSNYYAHRPYVEARESVPDPWVAGDTAPNSTNYPWLWAGIGGFSPALIVGEDGCPANELPDAGGVLCGGPQALPQLPSAEQMPWMIFLAMQNCICAEGRFDPDYENVLGCWMCGSGPAFMSATLPPPPVVGPPWLPPNGTTASGGLTSDDDPHTNEP